MTASTATEVADKLHELSDGLYLPERLGELESVLRSLEGDKPESDRARSWASVDLFAAFLSEANDIPENDGRGRVWRPWTVASKCWSSSQSR